jgi:hypothetical protein
MTQDDFFGAIEHNLQRLAAKGERVGACGDRVRGFRCITRGDSYCPPNVRCYDLLPDEPGSGASAVFRVFACFADESTHDGYRRAKFAIRKWYQESGRARGCEQPRAALVVGAAAQWPEGMEPNADDMPCGSVAFRMLAAPHVRPEMGLGIAKAGDFGSFRAVCRALVPEAFDKVERRVRDCVERLFLPDGSVVGGGYLTARRVMDELPMIPCDFVVEVFGKMQNEGGHRVEKLPRAEGRETPETRICIKLGPPVSAFERRWVVAAVCLAVLAAIAALWFFLAR